MASKLKFDTPEPSRPPVPPAGPPSPPISSLEPLGGNYNRDPSVPISADNTDYSNRKLKFDPPSEKDKSLARIREIAGKLQGGEMLPPGPLDTITDAASLSTSRPISAAITAGVSGLTNSYPGSSYDERYQALIQYMNDRQARGDAATGPVAPLVRGVASLPASMATGGGSATVNTITKGAAAPARTVAGAATNPVTAGVRSSIPASTTEVAARAAVPGFIEGAAQNAESLESAAKGGATNAALSGGSAAVLDKGMKTVFRPARRAAEAEATAARGRTPEEIAAEAKTHYNELDNQGIRYDHNQTNTLQSGLRTLRSNSVYVPRMNAGLDTLYDDLLERAQHGSMSFNDLDNARSAIGKLARGSDESTRVAARSINNEIDRMIGSGPPAINPNNVNVDEAYRKARGLSRQKALTEDAMYRAENVEQKIEQKSNVNPNQAMKDEFGAVAKQYRRPGAYNPLEGDPEGRDMLARIVRGGPAQNTLASVGNTLSGRFAPWAGGAAGLALPTAFGISKNVDPYLATLIGAPFGAAAAGVTNQAGKLAQRGAASLGEKDVNAYLRHLSGSPQPVPGAAINRDDLTKILFAQDLERIAPRYASGAIGEKTDEQKKKEKKP